MALFTVLDDTSGVMVTCKQQATDSQKGKRKTTGTKLMAKFNTHKWHLEEKDCRENRNLFNFFNCNVTANIWIYHTINLLNVRLRGPIAKKQRKNIYKRIQFLAAAY